MQKFMLWNQRNPVIVIIILLAVSVFFAYYAQFVKVDVSIKSFWMEDDPAKAHYDNYVDVFGSDKLTTVYVKAPDLFTPQKLEMLSEFHSALEDMDYVDEVDSLFSVANFKGNDGMLLTDPFIEDVPETIEEAEQIKHEALRNPVAVKNLIASDGSAITFNIFLEDVDVPDYEIAFSKKLDELIATIAPSMTEVFQLGGPYLVRTSFDSTMRDNKTIVPIGLILFTATMILIWRSFRMLGLALLTSGLSILWTIGFMGMRGIPMDFFTTIIPVLLIVIGSTEDIHIFAEYIAGLRTTGTRTAAVRYMINKSSIALSLTALTTFLGFMAISFNKITMLKNFGFATAFGMLANPLITFMLAPVFLQFLGPEKVTSASGAASGFLNNLFSSLSVRLTHILHTHKKLTFSLFLGVIIFIGVFSSNIKVDNDLVAWFKPSTPVRIRSQKMHEEIAGIQTFVIHISSGIEDTFKRPENLAQVEKIQEYLRQTDWCGTALSVVDSLKLTNREIQDGTEQYYTLPDSRELVAQYFLLMPPDEMVKSITDDYSQVNIVVRHNVSSSHQLKKLIAETDAFIAQTLNPHFRYYITGEAILSTTAADSIAIGQMRSMLLVLLVIFVIMSLLFVNIKAGFLSLIPNLMPVILLCGTMGLFGIFLNTATSMVAVVAIGIAVDDTIHFMTRYYKEMRQLQDRDKAVAACVQKELRPIISTSVGLTLGFVALAFSTLLPIIHYGLLSAFVLMAAMLADLLITPIVISSTQLLTLWDMIDLRLKDVVIKHSPLFLNLKTWHIKKVVLLGNMLNTPQGEMVLQHGDAGRSMYLLLEGRVQVEAVEKATQKRTVVAQLGPGDVFGEIALVNPGPRTADIQATEDVQYLEIDWDSIERIRRIYPRIAANLYRNVAQILGQRLKDTTHKLMI